MNNNGPSTDPCGTPLKLKGKFFQYKELHNNSYWMELLIYEVFLYELLSETPHTHRERERERERETKIDYKKKLNNVVKNKYIILSSSIYKWRYYMTSSL